MTPLLRNPADARTLLFVAIAYLLAFGGYFLHELLPWWAELPLIFAAGWFAFVTAVITHNTIHAPIFKSRSLNRLFQLVLTLGYGHPVSAFVPGHNLSHHVHTQTRRDVMRTTKLRFRWHFLNFLLGPAILGGDITRADLGYATAMRTERPRWFRQWVAEWLVFLGVQGTLLYLNPLAFLLYQVFPHTCAAAGIVGMNLLQHDGCDMDSEYNHSRNFVGTWINWWCFNNGFHTIHHKHPGLHWSELPRAHAEQIAPHIHPNLDEPDMGAYILRTFFAPGGRVDMYGNPLVLPEEGPDESWIPGRGDTPVGVSLGAEL